MNNDREKGILSSRKINLPEMVESINYPKNGRDNAKCTLNKSFYKS